VNTDTRTVAPGSCSSRLRGERFDAHTFVGDAVNKGATGVVVSDAALRRTSVSPLRRADTTSR
jgi:UDP-N-acetylmuramoyl-tripeptide--D-alanyl-D-alanine ligase